MGKKVDHEARRLLLQHELDAKKTALERNKLGQFATPTALAREILSFGLGLMPTNQPIRFLDPAIGTGSFYSALLQGAEGRSLELAKGFEVDEHYGLPARELWAKSALDIEISDFTQAQPPHNGFNLLICNPPYIRHQHLGVDEKQRLRIASKESSGVSLSGLAGFYCHFMALSHRWMSDDAVAGWLIPSEFMDVNYGQELKRYLLKGVTLLRIHRFNPKDAQFDDALVSSAVVWFKKSKPPADHAVEFSYGGTHAAPVISRKIKSSDLADENKWTRFPALEVRVVADTPILSDLFSIKRGIATGSNEFFILSKQKIVELNLPMQFFRPILPSPRYLKEGEIQADEQGNPILSQSLFLLNCHLPEDEVKANYPNLWRYLESGKEEMGSRYLCKSRPIWYKQEDRKSTQFVCTYMGRRNSSTGNPFRFLLNHSSAIVANTYLMLYPKPHVSERLAKQPGILRDVWSSLNNIRPETLMSEGRVYGGGLHKMEPRELANVSAVEISKILNL